MRRARIALLGSVLCGPAVFGCGGGGGAAFVPASSDPRQNVMVIDTGFDLSVRELRGKVAAAYTETCVDEPSGGGDDAGASDAGAASFDEVKQAFLAQLSVPDNSCALSPGVSVKTDPLASIAKYQARWNAMISDGEVPTQIFTPAEIMDLQAAMDKENQTFAYHGTTTSGTVAHENPDVRLVLVEQQLESEAEAMASFQCFVQSDIDQIVQLLNDPDVYTAFVNQPARIDGDLADAARANHVGVINESFGAAARVTLEDLQLAPESNCPTAIDLSGYFSILNKAELAHAATIDGPPVLTVQSAGNDGAEIDSGADSLSCDPGDPLALLVGSYDPLNEELNTFSNSGACVDVYAPGQAVIAPYAGGWLLSVDGTSYSAPMVARAVSLTAPSPYDPAQARTALLAMRLPASATGGGIAPGSLPAGLFPSDFFYLPFESPVDALIFDPAATRAAAPHRSLSRVDWHRLLRPLSLLRAIRRG